MLSHSGSRFSGEREWEVKVEVWDGVGVGTWGWDAAKGEKSYCSERRVIYAPSAMRDARRSRSRRLIWRVKCVGLTDTQSGSGSGGKESERARSAAPSHFSRKM